MNSMEDLLYPGKNKNNAKPKSEENTESLKDAQIAKILSNISQKESISEQERIQIIKDFRQCYKNNYRHSYYAISVTMYKMNENQIDKLTTGLSFIKANIDKKDIATYNGIKKLNDHVQLEAVRIKENNDLKMKILKIGDNNLGMIKNFTDNFQDNLEETQQKSKAEYEEYDKKLKKYDEIINNILAQIVSILGLFAAIVIVFFGGSSVFANVFSQLNDISWKNAMPLILAVGFIMFNTIFMFLYVVKELVSNKSEKVSVIEWMRRHPYVLIFNCTTFLIFIMCA